MTGSPDFSSEKLFGEIDKILFALEGQYGLNRNEALHCLKWTASCLEDFKPGDPGLEASFHSMVMECANDFQPWADKVYRKLAEGAE